MKKFRQSEMHGLVVVVVKDKKKRYSVDELSKDLRKYNYFSIDCNEHGLKRAKKSVIREWRGSGIRSMAVFDVGNGERRCGGGVFHPVFCFRRFASAKSVMGLIFI